MHRTHLAGLCAVALPGALAVGHGIFAAPVLLGLWLTRSWTAWLASLVGVTWLYPWFGPVAILLILAIITLSWSTWCETAQAPLDRWLPYGATLDGLRARLLSWLYLSRHLTWCGHGAGTTRYAVELAHVRSGGRSMEGGPDARNEPLQILYEHGWRGGLVLGVLIAAIGPWLRLESSWSATAVSAAVVCCGTSPLRAFRRWLVRGDGPLFGSPVRASFTVYIDADLKAHLYGTPPTDRALQLVVARAFLNLGQAWMRQHGLPLDEVVGGQE